jgi:hypothetical protein
MEELKAEESVVSFNGHEWLFLGEGENGKIKVRLFVDDEANPSGMKTTIPKAAAKKITRGETTPASKAPSAPSAAEVARQREIDNRNYNLAKNRELDEQQNPNVRNERGFGGRRRRKTRKHKRVSRKTRRYRK